MPGGCSIVDLSGNNFAPVAHGDSFKFRIDLEVGYNANEFKVLVNGVEWEHKEGINEFNELYRYYEVESVSGPIEIVVEDANNNMIEIFTGKLQILVALECGVYSVKANSEQ